MHHPIPTLSGSGVCPLHLQKQIPKKQTRQEQESHELNLTELEIILAVATSQYEFLIASHEANEASDKVPQLQDLQLG